MRWSNSDPVTGQAAWYDLMVRIEKADTGGEAEPNFPAILRPVDLPEPPDELRYGQEWAS
jgi:hypothetical protein